MGAIAYTVRRSQRARRAHLVVTADGVELVVPRAMALAEAAPLVRERRRWIERHLRRLAESRARNPLPDLVDGGSVPYLGRDLILRVLTEPGRRRPRVRHRGDVLEVTLGEHGTAAVVAALERWYRRRAREEIGRRLDAASGRVGQRYGRLTIRDQRTRWASCSPTGAMSFNWRLLLAPEPILEYVVEHEVAHLEVPDHSPRFWRLLARRLPGYRERQSWLRAHGHSLRLR